MSAVVASSRAAISSAMVEPVTVSHSSAGSINTKRLFNRVAEEALKSAEFVSFAC
jgi:hypothetical protein